MFLVSFAEYGEQLPCCGTEFIPGCRAINLDALNAVIYHARVVTPPLSRWVVVYAR
jgi:hypothetical protein